MKDISSEIKTACISVAEINIELHEGLVPLYTKEIFASIKIGVQLAVKNAFSILPDVYPTLIDAIEVLDILDGTSLKFMVTVKAIHKDNLNSEAMLGASVAAITLSKMLETANAGIAIGSLKIVKSKSISKDFKSMFPSSLKAGIIVCSDTISKGKREDKAGKVIMEKLKESSVEISHYEVIPDEKNIIVERALELSKTNNLLIYTGGTGLSFRDITPEALKPLLERNIPGVEEAIRSYGQERMPFAMLSRSVAGTIGNCLILALPGSTNGAQESMDAIFPHILHIFKILKGQSHD